MRIPPVGGTDMPHVQMWTSCVKVFESYRLTDRQTDKQGRYYISYHAASRVVKEFYDGDDDDE